MIRCFFIRALFVNSLRTKRLDIHRNTLFLSVLIAVLFFPPAELLCTTTDGGFNFGLINQSTNLKIDSYYLFPTDDISEPYIRVHFFSSRPTARLGYWFSIEGRAWKENNTGFGLFLSISNGKTDYWMNWEIENSLAFDPLRAQMSITNFSLGFEFLYRLKFLELSPYLEIGDSFYDYEVKFLNTTYSTKSPHSSIGLSWGLKASLRYRRFSVFAAIAQTKIFSKEWGFCLSNAEERTMFGCMGGDLDTLSIKYYFGLSYAP